MSEPSGRALQLRKIMAFAIVSIVWGSTYLTIKFAIATIPPFMMAGGRYLLAGVPLYLWARWRGAARPNVHQWIGAAIVGGLMLLGGNGGVVWAEQHVPSGLTAILVSTMALWMALFDWMRPGGKRPSVYVFIGLLLGLAGVVILVGPSGFAGGDHLAIIGAVVVVFGAAMWAAGSLASKYVRMSPSPLLATAMEMLAGSVFLTLAGGLNGEWGRIDLAHASTLSVLSLLYLVVFGSLIAYTAYTWLLRVASPARVSTYTFINPVVAVLLGWLFASEALTLRTLVASAIIVASVAMITIFGAVKNETPSATLVPEAEM